MSNDQAPTWADLEKDIHPDAFVAIEKAGLEFFDENKIGPSSEHYLMLESLSWKVGNQLRAAGFKIDRGV